jgi:hypothetical protein
MVAMNNELPSWKDGETVDYGAEIEETKREMQHAEDALMEAGFSEQHSRLIQDYISSSIMNHQLREEKNLRDNVGDAFGDQSVK